MATVSLWMTTWSMCTNTTTLQWIWKPNWYVLLREREREKERERCFTERERVERFLEYYTMILLISIKRD